jgi:N-acetylneuraminic acid mutarotase
MMSARFEHTATLLLPNGQVLVAGGFDATGAVLNTAELYDPNTGQWGLTGNLNFARAGHTATLLGNGDVLIAGGYDNGGVLASAEIYHLDATTGQGQWVVANNLHVSRAGHSATLLSPETVLVAGGFGGDGKLTSAELYDSTTGQWTLTGSLIVPRSSHTATVLPDGTVLAVGGISLLASEAAVELVRPGAQVILEWDPENDPKVRGYKVYYGTTSGSYQGVAIAGRETKYVLSNLTGSALYYFAVTSFTGAMESRASNEVSKFIEVSKVIP